jgi:glyoxylase-like metal-dependent hydrolase (beta-lactamase superfamily II)
MSDHDAARASLERILEWDFDRVIIGHGDIVETDGREKLEQAFAWME